MNYKCAISKEAESFSKEAQDRFAKRDKSSSKCLTGAYTHDSRLDSTPITNSSKKLGMYTVPSFQSNKPYSSININGKKLSLDNIKNSVVSVDRIIVKSKCEDRIDTIIKDCLKEGLEFDDTLKILEANNLIKSSLESRTQNDISSNESSENGY